MKCFVFTHTLSRKICMQNMNLFVFLTVSVILGAVYCDDPDCFNRKVTSCNQGVLDNLVTEPDSCPVILRQSKCVLSAAIDCRMNFTMKAQQADEYLRKVCNGTMKYFEENKQCYITAVSDPHCYKDIEKIMSNKTTPKEVLKAQKDVCEKIYWFERCLIYRVESQCGDFSYEIYSIAISPIFQLYFAYCNDVIEKAGENTDQYYTFGLPIIIELIAAIFHNNE